MARKLELTNLNDLIRRYQAGTPIKQLADECGVGLTTVYRRLTAAAVPRPGNRMTLDDDTIVARYRTGMSVNQLAAERSISRNVIERILRAHHIPLRSQSEAERLKWRDLREDRAAVERQCGAAWAARRGQRVSLEIKIRSARTRMRNLARIVPTEQRLIDWLRDHHVSVQPQQAVGPYNVDLVLDPPGIAVEIQSANHRRPWSSVRRERLEYILDRGWAVVVVWIPLPRRLEDIAPVGEQLIALAERMSREPALRGQYGVIGRDGQPMTPRGYNLPRRPRILGF